MLTNTCRSKYCLALREGDSKTKKDALAFQKLIEKEWNDRVNRVALKRMQTEKRRKISTIPLTADLQIFRDYLIRNIEQLYIHLKKHPCAEDWVLLAKFVLSRLILFNKRRRAEVRELKVSAYLSRPKWNADDNGELSLALSPIDRHFAER